MIHLGLLFLVESIMIICIFEITAYFGETATLAKDTIIAFINIVNPRKHLVKQ